MADGVGDGHGGHRAVEPGDDGSCDRREEGIGCQGARGIVDDDHLGVAGCGGDSRPDRLRPRGTAGGHDDLRGFPRPTVAAALPVVADCARAERARPVAEDRHLIGGGHHDHPTARPDRRCDRPVDDPAPTEGLQLLGPPEATAFPCGHEDGPDDRDGMTHAH